MSRRFGIPRRTFLRGAGGVACALPALDAMAAPTAPAATAGLSSTPASAASVATRTPAAGARARPRRLCVLYVPNGVSVPPDDHPAHADWTCFPLALSAGFDRALEFTKTLEPLSSFREQLSIVGGLSHPRSRNLLGHAAGDTFLTGGDIGGEYRNSISMDQVAARALGRATRHTCLILSSDGGIGYKSRVSTLSFDAGGNPIPSEANPRQIFERFFRREDAGSEAAARRRLAESRKVVDVVAADARELGRRLGAQDRHRLEEHMTVLAEIEDRIDRAESWIGRPVGVTARAARALRLDANQASPAEYIRTMCDLIVLAFQTDLTRVVTYMIAREDGLGLGDQFPRLALGLGGHHQLSHDRNEGAFERWARYDRFLAEQLAYFLRRLSETRDAHGPLLESTVVLYGSACSTTHNARNYPLVLAGGQAMGLGHGRYLRLPESTPLANLFVSLLSAVGVRVRSFADSTGALVGLDRGARI
jgi:hypothetical protein